MHLLINDHPSVSISFHSDKKKPDDGVFRRKPEVVTSTSTSSNRRYGKWSHPNAPTIRISSVQEVEDTESRNPLGEGSQLVELQRSGEDN